MSDVYSKVVDDVLLCITSGMVPPKLLSAMMNPYDVYIVKKRAYSDKALPTGKARVEVEYKGYFATSRSKQTTDSPHPLGFEPLDPFITNKEVISLGVKSNAYGLEMALYKIRENESCNIYIPWRLAYGEHGAGNLIPPKTDILFELTIRKIQSQGNFGQPVRFDKCAKMKQKWNISKQTKNILYVQS